MQHENPPEPKTARIVVQFNLTPEKRKVTFTFPTVRVFSKQDMLSAMSHLFQELNIVEGYELISSLRMAVPSMSVGDTVTFHQIDGTIATWKCSAVGWTPLDLTERMQPSDETDPFEKKDNALRLMILDPKIKAFLIENDPKAYEQFLEALRS